MHWEKLKASHYFSEPVEHIYTSTIFDQKIYDKLYENQNDLNHKVWQDFKKMYKVGYEFLDDIKQIDLKLDTVCVWFFKERTDRSAGDIIRLHNKKIIYKPNTFLLTISKELKIIESHEYIRRPCLQLQITKDQFTNITTNFRK
jgi:hypothetical protein